jgi:NAD(P)-dependent dehydrogenase (short-subunit alcohol dehydrogenase family)
MTTLSGKVELVTGETLGIGKVTASALAQAGAKVVVAGHR